jgi:hypothetical protein
MSSDPCQPIIDEINQLKDDIANVQAVLDRDFPPLTRKQREEATQQLQAAQNKLAQRETELLQCRQQNPEPPKPLQYLLAPDSPAVAVGDIVCVALSAPTPPGTPGTNVYKATTTGLANGAAPLGIVTAVNGASITVADFGTVLANITSLGAGIAAPVRVSATARCERVATPSPLDFITGTADATGNVTIDAHSDLAVRERRVFNVRLFGAKGDGKTDDLAAFNAAIAAMGPAMQFRGATLEVPPGNYYLSDNLHLTRQMIVQGASGGGGAGGTTLTLAAGKSLIVDNVTTAPDGGRGDNTVIRDLDIVGTQLSVQVWQATHSYAVNDVVKPSTVTGYYYTCTADGQSGGIEPLWPQPDVPGAIMPPDNQVTWKCLVAPGILLHARAYIHNVEVYNFTNSGIHIQASHFYCPKTNANGFHLSQVAVVNCGGHGVLVVGDDASAGLGSALDLESCSGYGIYDHSFLGCTWVMPQAAGCGRGAYRLDGGNARSILVGAYAEADNPPSRVMFPSMVVGGIQGSGFDSSTNGLILRADGCSPITVQNSMGVSMITSLAGIGDSSMTAFGLLPVDDHPFGTRWQYDGAGRWRVVWANSNMYQSFAVTTAKSLPGPGAFCAPKILLGIQGTTERTLTFGSAAPTSGIWKQGDRIYNSAPVASGSEGWVCVRSGGFAGNDWTPITTHVMGDFIVPMANNPGQMTYQVTGYLGPASAFYGTTGANQPNWANAQNVGSTMNDGDLVWTCVGPSPPVFKDFGSIAP